MPLLLLWYAIHLVSHSFFFLFFGAKGIYEAVEGDFLDAHSLRLLNPYMPNLSASWLFQRAMSVRPHVDVSPTFINELLFANFQSMQKLGDSVLRSFLQVVTCTLY